MESRRDFEAQIRFQLDQLTPRNAHHEFEHICRQLARNCICSNVIPATGPVSSGGDQGRDFETFKVYDSQSSISAFFHTTSSGESIVFACTIQKTAISSKVRADMESILEKGKPVDRIHFFCTADVPVGKRHALQRRAESELSTHLEIHDKQWIAQELSRPELSWIAYDFLAVTPPFDAESKLGLYLDALAIDAIRAFEHRRQVDDFARLEADIHDLRRYTDRGYGFAVCRELLSAIGRIPRSLHRGLPLSTMHAVASTVSAALPIRTLVGKQQLSSDDELSLVEIGCYLGFDLAYYALKYLHDLVASNIGLDVLWEILRFAEVNDHDHLRRLTLKQFSRLEASAERLMGDRREDVVRWIAFRKEDALAIDESAMPEVPWDILEKFEGLNV